MATQMAPLMFSIAPRDQSNYDYANIKKVRTNQK